MIVLCFIKADEIVDELVNFAFGDSIEKSTDVRKTKFSYGKRAVIYKFK